MVSDTLSWDDMAAFFRELEAAEKKAATRFTVAPERKYEGLGYVGTALAEEVDKVANAPGGTRHNTLIDAASSLGSLVAGGELDEDETEKALFDAAKGNTDGPYWADSEILRTIRDGFRYGQENPRTAPKDEPRFTTAPAIGGVPPGVFDEDDERSWKDRILGALVTPSELDSIPDPVPVIKGLLFRDSTAWLFGAANQGKSFVAIDMAAAVAEGEPWMGRTVAKGPVVYLVAEGLSGIKYRRRAWEEHNGRVMSEDVKFLPMAVQVNGPAWAGLVEACAEIQPSMIILDTQQMISEGMDENSALDMGVLLGQVNRLRMASGACVMTVHHTGKNGTMRGSTATPGAAQTTIEVSQDADLITVRVEKQKDGGKPTLTLRLVVVEIGRDAEGDAITSCVVVDASDDGADEVARYERWLDSDEVAEIQERWRVRLGARDVTAGELAEVTDTPRATIDKLVHGLCMRGVVRMSGSGSQRRYTMITKTPQ